MKQLPKLKQVFLFVMIFMANVSYSQLINDGSEVPVTIMKDVINYHKPSIDLSAYRGKIVILNFWNQSCMSCIREFEKLDTLQKQFSDRVQIIMLNHEGKDSTLRFFAKRKKIRMPSLPMVTNARHLHLMFTKDFTPFQAWISEEGKLLYVTEPANLTAGNLLSLLNGNPLNIHTQPLSVRNGITETPGAAAPDSFTDAVYFSRLGACNKTMKWSSEARVDEKAKTIGIILPCLSALRLFKIAFTAYDQHRFISSSQIALELDDTIKNQLEMVYSYEAKWPLLQKHNRYILMQHDLQVYFNVKAMVEQRKLTAWVLRVLDDGKCLQTKGGNSFDNLWPSGLKNYYDDPQRKMINKPFTIFIERIGRQIEMSTAMPFIDMTGLDFNIDICFSEAAIDPLNVEQLIKELKRYNLALSLEEQWVDTLVIKQ